MSVNRDEQRQALWRLWLEYSDSKNSPALSASFAALRRAACGMLSADAARFARLGDSDENIYTHIVHLMDVYREVVRLAGECVSAFESGSEVGLREEREHESPAAALLTGICEVLNSRLSDEIKPDENPVTREKRGIIESAVVYTSRRIDDEGERCAARLKADEPPEIENLLRESFDEIYSNYREGLRFCLAGLNDLYARKTARFYTELIEREWEELGNIIHVQVRALEEADCVSVGQILDILREAYRQTGPLVDELQKLLHAPPNLAPYRSFGEFEAELSAALAAMNDEESEQGKRFFAALADETKNAFDGLRLEYLKAAYKLQQIISGDILLAEEITGAFSKAAGKLPGISEEISMEFDILNGISETIEIKIDSLKESVQTFNQQGLGLVGDFAAEKITGTEEERQEAIDAVRARWLEQPPENIDNFFEESDIFAPARERVEKQINTYFEKAEKAAFRFKKEVLLYEVCTYEEILIHSVSRLRDSEREDIKAAVVLLDETFRALEVILKKNNIEVIRPAIKEQFNAKEHEVLVAEKHEGFEKGEIIKILTAGYKQKDRIILRANVIAAR